MQYLIFFKKMCRKLELHIGACSGFSRRVKNGSFFTFFQLRSSGYAPLKMQKLTKNQPVLPPAENPEQAIRHFQRILIRI
jgi:hypothetical protein